MKCEKDFYFWEKFHCFHCGADFTTSDISFCSECGEIMRNNESCICDACFAIKMAKDWHTNVIKRRVNNWKYHIKTSLMNWYDGYQMQMPLLDLQGKLPTLFKKFNKWLDWLQLFPTEFVKSTLFTQNCYPK